jgi:alkylhydroperoxidase family enzyme
MGGSVPQGVTSGRTAVAVLAPTCVAAVDGLEATAWAVLDPDLVDLTARACAAVHGTVPLARPTALGASPWADRDAAEWRAFGDLTAEQRTALAFAEQFAVDVSAVGDADRAALSAALGDRAVTYAQVLYVADVVTRARTVLDRLFGPSTAAEAAVAVDGPAAADAWSAIEEIIRVVPGLEQLDAVTTELVRLRGARQHNCRICQSLRSYSAFEAGADDDTFAAVDTYATSGLSTAHKAALAFTDAFIWTPGRIADAVVDDLRTHWSPAQQVELVLDIARNASNKFAVAMAADGTDVTEGYAVYDVKADGSIEYGLSRP